MTNLISSDMRERLLSNGKELWASDTFDPKPVLKLFTPDGNAKWLLAAIDPNNCDIAFGLCDLGHGWPELGTVRISDLEAYRGRLGLSVEIDALFKPRFKLSDYARLAHAERAIID